MSLAMATESVERIVADETAVDWDEFLALATAMTGVIARLPFRGRDQQLAVEEAWAAALKELKHRKVIHEL